MTEFSYEIFADYHQFYLQDEQADGDLSDSWTPEATANLLALAPGTIGVGTVRNTDVSVKVLVLDQQPVDDDLQDWDQVYECSVFIPSGRIVIAGTTDYFPDAARITVAPGWYRGRIYYGGLSTLSEDGLEGDDHYKIAFWPAPEAAHQTVKRHAV